MWLRCRDLVSGGSPDPPSEMSASNVYLPPYVATIGRRVFLRTKPFGETRGRIKFPPLSSTCTGFPPRMGMHEQFSHCSGHWRRCRHSAQVGSLPSAGGRSCGDTFSPIPPYKMGILCPMRTRDPLGWTSSKQPLQSVEPQRLTPCMNDIAIL